jgi:predicted aconitase with swiveling domain
MSSAKFQLEVLVAASPARSVQGRALHLVEPISFWGGVSPTNALITDPRQPHHGQSIADRVVIIRELRGSSSGSSVLLELIYKRIAPCAIVCAAPDAILALGILVASEMHWPAPGIFELPVLQQLDIPEDSFLTIDSRGYASVCEGQA